MSLHELLNILYLLAVNISATLFIHYVIEPGRILGFVGKFLDRWYDAPTDTYPIWIRWFTCYRCFNFWQSLPVGYLFFHDITEAVFFAILSHTIISRIRKL